MKNKFNRDAHRANNERLVHEYRSKMRSQAGDLFQTQEISKWTHDESINLNTFQSRHQSEDERMMLNMASSGLIQEVSQELESLNAESQKHLPDNRSL